MKKFFCRLLRCCEPASDITLSEAGARVGQTISASDRFFIEGVVTSPPLVPSPIYRVLINRSNGATIGVSGYPSLREAVDTVITEYRRQAV